MRISREWMGGTVILILSWLSYQGYEGLFFFHIPFYLKHVINLALLTAVAAVGYSVWNRHAQKWTVVIWRLVYAVVLCMMIIVGFLDLFIRFDISNFREMIHNLRMFFTSPVPYGIILFLVSRLKEKQQAQQQAKPREPDKA